MLCPEFFVKFNETALFRGNRQKMPGICENTLCDRLRGSSCFLLARDPVGNGPHGPPHFFGHFPKCIRYSVSSSIRFRNFTRNYTTLTYCSNYLKELLVAFPNVPCCRFEHFLSISLGAACFFLLRLKIKDTTYKFINHQ
jgi:hypothetical protein